MKAYDNNLHWHMCYQVKVQNLRHREVARNLCLDQSTVSCTVALFDDTGDVKKRKYSSKPGTVNLTDYDKLVILETVIDQPVVFLREHSQTYTINRSIGTVYRRYYKLYHSI